MMCVFSNLLLQMQNLLIWLRLCCRCLFGLLFLLKLGLKFPCTISIIWKRGEKLAEVLTRREIVNGVATFNEQLSIDCNMIFDVNKKLFEAKKVPSSLS